MKLTPRLDLTNPLPSFPLSFRLTVHYPPILTLTSKRERVLEGDSVRFRCAAESGAGDSGATSFTWFVGGRRVRIDKDSADFVSEFTLESADRRLNGHMVKCEAENAVGRSDVSMLLDVSCECSVFTDTFYVTVTRRPSYWKVLHSH